MDGAALPEERPSLTVEPRELLVGTELAPRSVEMRRAEGPEVERLKDRIAQLGLQQQVVLAGFQSQISPWLEMADCFVLPSLTEGTPMALLEAMAEGVPVVATGVGGVPDVITHDVSGLLVPSANAMALCEGMSRIRNSSELREKYRFEARKTIDSRFSVQPWCQKILKTYQDIYSTRHLTA